MNESSPQALYHYCSADSLLAITDSRTLRLSSLSLSNDSMEGRVLGATLMRLADIDRLTVPQRGKLKDSLLFLERSVDGLGFCLSEEGDLLSQWRGYADDAQGVAIGFNRTYLSRACANSRDSAQQIELVRVVYDEDEQRARVAAAYEELKQFITDAARRAGTNLLDTRSSEEIAADDERTQAANAAVIGRLVDLVPRLYELKAAAFAEEKEWRLATIRLQRADEPCQFRHARGRIIPFVTVPLIDLGVPVISEVVLGPRHQTPPDVVSQMLRIRGFGPVSVRPSAATYR